MRGLVSVVVPDVRQLCVDGFENRLLLFNALSPFVVFVRPVLPREVSLDVFSLSFEVADSFGLVDVADDDFLSVERRRCQCLDTEVYSHFLVGECWCLVLALHAERQNPLVVYVLHSWIEDVCRVSALWQFVVRSVWDFADVDDVYTGVNEVSSV